MSSSGTAHGDYFFTMCLDRGGFQATPHTLEYESQIMTVIVEGRKPQFWTCKQLGHFSRSCPQKTIKPTSPPPTSPLLTTTTTTTTSTTTATATTKITPPTSGSPKPETGDHPDKEEEGWTHVTREWVGKKNSPLKTQIPKPTQEKQQNKISTATVATTAATKEKKHHHHQQQYKKKKKEKTIQLEIMNISFNLKRRRDSGDSLAEEEGEKNIIKKPSLKPSH